MVEYRKNAHAVWDVKYHVIWVTKYRYKVLRGEMSICFFCTPTVVDFEAVDASKFFQNPKKQDIFNRHPFKGSMKRGPSPTPTNRC